MISGLNHLTLAVRNIETSFQFYKDVLGLKPLVKWSSGAYLLAGSTWICLSLDPKTSTSKDYTHVAFSVSQEDFEKLGSQIRNSGSKIFKENQSEGDSLYFFDPDRHKIEIHVGDWTTRIADAKRDPWDPDMVFYV